MSTTIFAARRFVTFSEQGRFNARRLEILVFCNIGTSELQQFVLQKVAGGLAWKCADHHRNVLSKIFVAVKKWGFFAGDNPAIGGD